MRESGTTRLPARELLSEKTFRIEDSDMASDVRGSYNGSLREMVAPFGAFRPLCHTVPSYPICNLFFRQVSAYPNLQDLSSPRGAVLTYDELIISLYLSLLGG